MEFKSSIPIYQQVIEEIKKEMVSGRLKPGDKLPSSRELAIKYAINPNTAARVYSEMESMGLSYTKRGIGTFVVENTEVIRDLKEEIIERQFKELDEQLSMLGYRPEEIVDMLRNYYEMNGK